MKENHYYNTTRLEGEALKQAWANAKSQEEKIMVLFRKYPDRMYTPDEVTQMVFEGQRVPITSVRRAITSLTNMNLLMKTGVMRPGTFGKPCYCWKLNVSRGT